MNEIRKKGEKNTGSIPKKPFKESQEKNLALRTPPISDKTPGKYGKEFPKSVSPSPCKSSEKPETSSYTEVVPNDVETPSPPLFPTAGYLDPIKEETPLAEESLLESPFPSVSILIPPKKQIDPSILTHPFKRSRPYKQVNRTATVYGWLPNYEHASPWDPHHPESPNRVEAIHEKFLPYMDRLHLLEKENLFPMTSEVLGQVHSEAYINKIESLGKKEDPEEAMNMDMVYYTKDTVRCATLCAQMSITMGSLVADGIFSNGFLNIRPPGHKASVETAHMYCLFNTIAITASYLIKYNLAKKVLIVDFDANHGYGTQKIFYNNNKVLYFSVHRYDHGTAWPYKSEANYDHIGTGNGKGFNVNVPLNETGLGDFDYLAIVLNVLLPMAYEFQPSIILLACGYTACLGDPVGSMNVTPAFFGHLVTLLDGVAEGKILTFLEGGYATPFITEAALRTLRALLNDPCDPLEHATDINPSVKESINNVKSVLRPYWKCFGQFDNQTTVEGVHSTDKPHRSAAKHFLGVPPKPPYSLVGGYPTNRSKHRQMLLTRLTYMRDEVYGLDVTKVGYLQNPESIHHAPPKGMRSPENPMRLSEIMAKLKEYNMLNALVEIDFDYNPKDLINPTVWSSVCECLNETHHKSYLFSLSRSNKDNKPDLYWGPSSKETCLWSVASLFQLALKMKDGVIRHGIGLVRPPGHMAKYAEAVNMCIINSVAVTANYLVKKLDYKRVLIVDFDIHHGSGTQEITYSTNNIMYISVHRYDYGMFFPKEITANHYHIGSENGLGYNINVPFNRDIMTNVDYLQTWIRIVVPLAYAYNPEFIIVSAGFDAGIRDRHGGYFVHPEVFGHMVQLLKPIAPLLLALEGGYHSESTSLGMMHCIRALLGYPMPMPILEDAQPSTKRTIANVVNVVKPFWPILDINEWLVSKPDTDDEDGSSGTLEDVI